MMTIELLNDEQAAGVLGVSRGTLANWRCSRLAGPRFVKIGRLVRYRPQDLQEYVEARTVNTTDTTAGTRATP